MRINIIHLPQRKDRWSVLMEELKSQQVSDYWIWQGITDKFNSTKGISRAHKRIVKHALDMNLNEILIAEDDLKFTADGSFEFYINNKPIDYDLYLASIYYGKLTNTNIVKDFSGLTFYMINRRFYEKFLSVPEHDNLDRSLREMGKFVVCNPFTVIQHNGFSDNTKEYANYEYCLKNRDLFGVTSL